MFSFAKLFADIAKFLNAPTWLISHGITVIIVGGSAWGVSTYFNSQNRKIESVPAIISSIDILSKELQGVKVQLELLAKQNKEGHDSIKSGISRGFGEVKIIFIKQNELNDQRFNFLDAKNEDRFYLQRKWLNEEIEKMFGLNEKKNSVPYLTQSSQNQPSSLTE